METTSIVRRGRPSVVKQMRVGDLDKSRCSAKFLTHNFSDDFIVYVRCKEDGTFDLRGKKQEYRIIVPDANTELQD